jgi:hypothetical protein
MKIILIFVPILTIFELAVLYITYLSFHALYDFQGTPFPIRDWRRCIEKEMSYAKSSDLCGQG